MIFPMNDCDCVYASQPMQTACGGAPQAGGFLI